MLRTAWPDSATAVSLALIFFHADQIADRRDHAALVHAGMIDDGSGGQGHDAKVDELVTALASFEPDQFDRMAANVEPRQQGLAAEMWEALQKSHG